MGTFEIVLCVLAHIAIGVIVLAAFQCICDENPIPTSGEDAWLAVAVIGAWPLVTVIGIAILCTICLVNCVNALAGLCKKLKRKKFIGNG